MTETIGGVTCEYVTNIDGRAEAPHSAVVLFLHGWGGDIRSFSAAYAAVCDWGMAAINFAFPTEVPEDWGVYDYAAYVRQFMRIKEITMPIVVGHSFGGRVGIILASQGLCGKLVLVDSAGMRPKLSIRRKLRIARYHYRVKHNKPLDECGSIDYNNTSVYMRPVFVRIVNSHLENLLGYITCPTLIVWGRRDRDTPPYMARRLKRGIADSRLVYLDGGHFCYAQAHHGFMRHLKSFFSAED